MNSSECLRDIVVKSLEESHEVRQRVLERIEEVVQIGELFVRVLEGGKTVFLFGNGGSAADAQHIAAELVGRFAGDRRSLPAVALTVNTSNLTAVANDYGYQYVFSRQIEGLARQGDLAVGISTSGNSPNVLEGVKAAREKGCITVGLTGEDGGRLKDLVDCCFKAPARKPSRIQEVHILVGHILCEIVEQRLFHGVGSVQRS